MQSVSECARAASDVVIIFQFTQVVSSVVVLYSKQQSKEGSKAVRICVELHLTT